VSSLIVVRVMRVSPWPWRPVSETWFLPYTACLANALYFRTLPPRWVSRSQLAQITHTNIASFSLFGNPLPFCKKVALYVYGWYVSYSNWMWIPTDLFFQSFYACFPTILWTFVLTVVRRVIPRRSLVDLRSLRPSLNKTHYPRGKNSCGGNIYSNHSQRSIVHLGSWLGWRPSTHPSPFLRSYGTQLQQITIHFHPTCLLTDACIWYAA